MESSALLTAEEFAAQRHEFPDGGRWTELIAGRPVALDPPDVEHGTVVLNLTKALGEFLQAARDRDAAPGYPCFEMGLLVARRPDTVRFPALSFFAGEASFAEMDNIFTARPPAIVVEVVSTQRRRSGIVERINAYFEHGVRTVWILDPATKEAHVAEPRRGVERLEGGAPLRGDPILAGFEIRTRDLFTAPKWWTG
ncbi:MAG: Uma2 family endonuclease [Planctomycetaceae bacterium]